MHNRSLVISWIKNDMFELQRDGEALKIWLKVREWSPYNLTHKERVKPLKFDLQGEGKSPKILFAYKRRVNEISWVRYIDPLS